MQAPLPVGSRSKAWVCGCSPAEIVGSNPTGAWMFFCSECCVLSGRGLCDELITHPEESYQLWCVVACDLETYEWGGPGPLGGCHAKNKQTKSQGLFHVPPPLNLITSAVCPEKALALATIVLMSLKSLSRLIFVRKNQRILFERETVS